MSKLQLPERAVLDRLWQAYWRRRTIARRNLLAEAYLPRVKQLAFRLVVHIAWKVEVDDLVAWGMFGLLNAIPRFESGRSQFQTFVGKCVIGSMLDGLRAVDHLPRLLRQRAKAIERAADLLLETRDGVVTEKDVCRSLDLTSQQYRQATVYLGSTDNGDHEQAMVLQDRRARNPLAEVAGEDLWRWLQRGLSARERRLLNRYHRDGLTMAAVANEFGLSVSRISQMHSDILVQIRERIEGEANADTRVACGCP